MSSHMLDQVRALIDRHALLRADEPVWVAVSGGLDSMVLLHVLRSLGYTCQVAHVDHGLRGAESEADRDLVKEYCRERGVVCLVHEVDVRERMERTGASVQMAARSLRLEWFNTLLDQGPHQLAMAHHADDAVETFIMGSMQGLGLHGWEAIPVRSGAFVRPLLECTRAGIEAYAHQHGITWREDASNADTSYLRNRVRHELLPIMEKWRPGSSRNILRSIRAFTEMKGLAERSIRRSLDTLATSADGTLRVPFEVIQRTGLPFLTLQHLLRERGFHPDQLIAMLESIRTKKVGAMYLHGEHQVLVDRAELVIGKATGPLRNWQIPSAADFPLEAPLVAEVSGPEAVDHGSGRKVAWVDADQLIYPLQLRPWRAGDRLRPVGLGGSKLVSDILIDAKVPRDRKERTYVLCDPERIIWLCGHRLAEEVAATSSTRRVMRLEWMVKDE